MYWRWLSRVSGEGRNKPADWRLWPFHNAKSATSRRNRDLKCRFLSGNLGTYVKWKEYQKTFGWYLSEWKKMADLANWKKLMDQRKCVKMADLEGCVKMTWFES